MATRKPERTRRRSATLGHLRVLIIALAGLACALTDSGCVAGSDPMPGSIITQGTASIPPSIMAQGTTGWLYAGGHLTVGDIGVSFQRAYMLDGRPAAAIAFGNGAGAPTFASLHLGESANSPGVATVYLVSFDGGTSAQRITLLVIPDTAPSTTPSLGVTPSTTP